MTNRFKTWRYWREEWVKPLAVAIILAMLIRIFIVQPFKIPSTSMLPTLKIGDKIFVNKFLYGAKIPFINKKLPKIRDPKAGDIIVFVSATDGEYPGPSKNYKRLMGPVFFDKINRRLVWYAKRYIVKRLIGTPGDKVEIRKGDVYINGKVLDDPLVVRAIDYLNAGDYGQAGKPVTVPSDSYFALGDNSPNSVDSRFWGFVPKKNVTGKAIFIWWPLNRIRIIH